MIFGVLNILTGIFVDAAMQARANTKAMFFPTSGHYLSSCILDIF